MLAPEAQLGWSNRQPRPCLQHGVTMLGKKRACALVGSLVAACALPPFAPAGTVLLGRSWQGRPIEAIEVGNPAGTRVLVVGCIHGNETGGIAITRALEQLSPAGLDLWIIP